jgi:translocation and assembly module TamB
MKLDALDIDSDQGKVNASGNAQLQDNWPVDITLNSTLNIDPLKGEKVKLKVGGEVRKSWVGVDLPVRWIWFCARKRSWRRPGCRSIWR